jgi:hypothetical protein
MSFPNTSLTKVLCFESNPGGNVWAIIVLALVFSCGQEDSLKHQSSPDFWEGNQTDFESGFSFQSKGNESVLHYVKTGQPYSGSIERNDSVVSTRQTFSSGKLNGLSTKLSNDGSRVEATYRNGLLHGKMIFYSADGTIRSVMNYEAGRLVSDPEGSEGGEANASSF